MADTQLYDHHDIQRYLQHNMTQQEMHDFEKALMNDPFLADALEGFSASDAVVAEKHLSEIEREIIGAKQQVKVVPMPLQKSAWWKVAAVVLTVVSLGVLTYSLFTKKGAEKNIAQKMSPEKATEMAAKTDSIGPTEKPLAQVEVLPKKEVFNKNRTASPFTREEEAEQVTVIKRRQMKADTVAIVMMEKNAGSSAFIDRNAIAATTLKAPANRDNNERTIEAKKMALPALQPESEFKGKAVNEKGEPLPSVMIYAPDRNISTTTDSEGNFTLKAADTALRLIASGVGYVPTELIIKRNALANFILDKGESTLSEVVVSAISKKKRNFNLIRTKERAEPESGWKNFEQYVNRQIDSLKASDNSDHYNENVELEFVIDNDGHPTSIQTSEKTDSIAEENAIHILSQGPKWKSRKKGERVKVIIPFE